MMNERNWCFPGLRWHTWCVRVCCKKCKVALDLQFLLRLVIMDTVVITHEGTNCDPAKARHVGTYIVPGGE